MRLTTFESIISLSVAVPCIWFGAYLLWHSRQSDPQVLYYSLMAGGAALWLFATVNSSAFMRCVLLATFVGIVACACATAQINLIRV